MGRKREIYIRIGLKRKGRKEKHSVQRAVKGNMKGET